MSDPMTVYPDPRDDLSFTFIEDCLRDYAAAIADGCIEGKFTVTDILEEADMIEGIFA